jgi:hypothetical protein
MNAGTARTRSIIENAEQAAVAGNHSSAEELLREAAALQEQTLGPDHPGHDAASHLTGSDPAGSEKDDCDGTKHTPHDPVSENQLEGRQPRAAATVGASVGSEAHVKLGCVAPAVQMLGSAFQRPTGRQAEHQSGRHYKSDETQPRADTEARAIQDQ